MIFKKNEVIELYGGKKYIVAETLNQDNNYYYCVFPVNKEETSVNANFLIITTVLENKNLFIKTVKGKQKSDLELIFKNKLKID